VSIWLSTSDAAQSKAGLGANRAYAIRRVDDGATTTIVVAARNAHDLTYGSYALLEALGARFFHPKQELVPTFGKPTFPRTLDLSPRTPMASRGIQFHTLHPIEYSPLLNEPSPEHLAGAKQLVDWLVKTGQNHLQWVLLATVPFDAWKPHATAILDYAHARGVTVGFAVQTWGGASLQNNYVLVSDATKWQAPNGRAARQAARPPLRRARARDGRVRLDGRPGGHRLAESRRRPREGGAPASRSTSRTTSATTSSCTSTTRGRPSSSTTCRRYADPRLGQTVHTLALFQSVSGTGRRTRTPTTTCNTITS
jgi:hypothetical protein